MLKAFKESVTNFVKTKPEVKRRPLIEQLIDDWEYVHKNFYQEHPDIERVHITQTDVPQRLSRIVKILSEEESMKTNQKEIHVCMEYFLKQNIMGGLYDLSQLNFPNGLFLEILKVFGSLISELDRKFLVHSSVHIPVLKILKNAITGEMTPKTEKEIVQLMFAMSLRLQDYPELLSIFFHEKKQDFVVEVEKLIDFDDGSEVKDEKEYDYPLFNYLLRFLHHEGQIGDYARTAILICLQTATPLACEYILNKSGFCQILVSTLGGRFSSLPSQLPRKPDDNFEKFLNTLDFYQKAIIESSPPISENLIQSIKQYFFQSIVLAKFTSTISLERELEATTVYVQTILQKITDKNLAHILLDLLLSDVEVSEEDLFKTTDITNNSPIKILFTRLNERSDITQIATWQLFYTLVTYHQNYVIPKLLPNTIQMSNKFRLKEKIEKVKHGQRYLELMPFVYSRDYEINGYENYLNDIQTLMTTSKNSKGNKMNGHIESTTELPGEHDIFLEIILGRLESLLTNSFDVNLMLTGIITQFICFPDACLNDYLLHSDLLYSSTPLSLYSILLRVSQEIQTYLHNSTSRQEHLEQMRNVMDESSKYYINVQPEEALALRNIIIFEEFLKELTATIQVQMLFGNEEIDYMNS